MGMIWRPYVDTNNAGRDLTLDLASPAPEPSPTSSTGNTWRDCGMRTSGLRGGRGWAWGARPDTQSAEGGVGSDPPARAPSMSGGSSSGQIIAPEQNALFGRAAAQLSPEVEGSVEDDSHRSLIFESRLGGSALPEMSRAILSREGEDPVQVGIQSQRGCLGHD